MVNNWTNSANFFSIYNNHYVQLVILEALLMHGESHLNQLPFTIAERIKGNHKVYGAVTGQYIIDRLVYLERLKFVSIENDVAKITSDGIDNLKNGSLQSITFTSFFNYKSLIISIVTVCLSIAAIIISIIALLKAK